MSTSVIVQARVNPDIKENASIVLESIGMSLSDAIRITLTAIAEEKSFPVKFRTPREETLLAIKEARENKSAKRYSDLNVLMEDLNA